MAPDPPAPARSAVATPAQRPVLFLSDLHLSPDRPAALAAFHAFARGPARAAAAVYILGDLFDWWIGDDQMRDPFVADVVAVAARHRGRRRAALRRPRQPRLHAGRCASRAPPVRRCCPTSGSSTSTASPRCCATATSCAPTTSTTRSIARACAIRPRRRACCACPTSSAARSRGGCGARAATRRRLKAESIMDVNAEAVADAFRTHGAAR